MDQPANELPPILPPDPGAVPGMDSVSEPVSRPWGFWATIGWTLVIGLGYVLAQAAVMYAYIYLGPRGGRRPTVEQIEQDGLVTALATILSAPVSVGLCVLFARMRKGIGVKDYLGLRRPDRRALVRWCFVIFAFGVTTDLFTTLVLKLPLVPEVMVELYRSTRVLPLLWLAIVLAAPVAEEFIFRGFLFTGLRSWRPTPMRDFATVIATSAAWAAIHLQYDIYGRTIVFLAGLLLGYARIRTGSLWLCIVMHAFMNLVATLEVALWLA